MGVYTGDSAGGFLGVSLPPTARNLANAPQLVRPQPQNPVAAQPYTPPVSIAQMPPRPVQPGTQQYHFQNRLTMTPGQITQPVPGSTFANALVNGLSLTGAPRPMSNVPDRGFNFRRPTSASSMGGRPAMLKSMAMNRGGGVTATKSPTQQFSSRVFSGAGRMGG